MAIDPATNNLQVLEEFSEEGKQVSRVEIFDEEGKAEGTFAGPGELGELSSPAGIAAGTDSEGFPRVFVGTNPSPGLPQVEIFEEETCKVNCPPAIESTSATGVTGDSATLRARVSPNGFESSYWFEYGPVDCEAGGCTKIPLVPVDIGAGRRGVSVSQALTGLAANTTYHYRVVAENQWDAEPGPDMTFTTQTSGLGFALGDNRVWEMVSPSDKQGGAIISTEATAIQAAASGSRLAYATLGSIFADSESSQMPVPATVLARRSSDGRWSAEDLTPPHHDRHRLQAGTEHKLFDPELLKAELEPTDDTPLSPEASERTPYLRVEGNPPSFTPLVNPGNVPPGTEFGGANNDQQLPLRIAAASPDLDHIALLSAQTPLASEATGAALYLWSGGDLETVSELPESEGGAIVLAMAGAGRGSVRGAVSEDGSRVFWTPGGDFPGVTGGGLYLRDTTIEESIRLDEVQSGSGLGAIRPIFNAASSDGSVVYFTDSKLLTANASPNGRDLYRCVVGPVGSGEGCVELTDVSAPLSGSGESAEVLGQVQGIGSDGARAYFVARGVLDENANAEGEVAKAKEPNLYLWEEGSGVRFIATLSEGDFRVWGALGAESPEPAQSFGVLLSAAASPSGRYLTFPSERSLTGYENKNEAGDPNTEAYLYDADADQLTCVSCNPSGAVAVGERLEGKVFFAPDPNGLWQGRQMAATLPESTHTETQGRSLYRPRTVFDNGRVFFNAVDPLVAGDSNGNWDVYQWEPLGVGSCVAGTSTASASRSGPGCVGLISAGTSEGDAGFLDASASGSDVFFMTRGRLSVLDTDTEVDVYDARVNGIAAVLDPIQECAGEACQPSTGSPNDPTPASEAFHGPEPQKPCRKGQRKVTQGGRTVCRPKKQKPKKHNKKKKQAGKNGRAGR
ncbi:MAG TPA: fibronectin type III domain-containing protein [Solirubrobacterales bacterium]|nr:fibronectin type III domain-containing protein [Solirubrobacterales bacterium]